MVYNLNIPQRTRMKDLKSFYIQKRKKKSQFVSLDIELGKKTGQKLRKASTGMGFHF